MTCKVSCDSAIDMTNIVDHDKPLCLSGRWKDGRAKKANLGAKASGVRRSKDEWAWSTPAATPFRSA